MLTVKLFLWALITGAFSWKCGLTEQRAHDISAKVRAGRSLQTAKVFARTATVGPIRIHVRYGDISVLSNTLQTRLKTVTIPAVVSWYSHILSLHNLSENWSTQETTCIEFSVPPLHRTTGIPNTDLVLYVKATTDADDNYVAYAAACAFDGEGSAKSPMAGMIMINSAFYTLDSGTDNEFTTLIHEVAHVLAFNDVYFPKFVQADGSLVENPMVDITVRGRPATILTTPKVIEKARAAFNCPSLEGVELENQGGAGTAKAHWDKRIMLNDFMVGDINPDAGFSDITMAVFEDSGWYSVNYDYTDQIYLGRNRGCSFFTSNCVVDGVAQFPEFCDEIDAPLCSGRGTKKAVCGLFINTENFPEPYQYFSNPQQGGYDELADYCPIAYSESNNDCTGRTPAPSIEPLYGEKVCADCRCFTGTYVQSGSTPSAHSGCHQVTCSGGVASVLVGSISVQCPAAGGQVSGIQGFDGYITCPPYDEACQPVYCLHLCSGLGKCVDGKCQCDIGYGGDDCSVKDDSACKTCDRAATPSCSACPPPCHSSCTHCAAPSLEGCMNEEEADFAQYVATTYSLPLTDETNGVMCYRQPVPRLDCDPLTEVTKAITEDLAGLHPTADQCYELLTVQWPFVAHWFNVFFSDFRPPEAAIPEETNMLKAVLQLWILQYGPSELSANPLWQGLISTFNNVALDWTQLLAWKGSQGISSGYSADGITKSSFPAALEASLTLASPELELFNLFSTLCDYPCSLALQCDQLGVHKCTS